MSTDGVNIQRLKKASLKTSKLMVKLMFKCGQFNFDPDAAFSLQMRCDNWRNCTCRPHVCSIAYNKLVSKTNKVISDVLREELKYYYPGYVKTFEFHAGTHPRVEVGYNPLYFALKKMGQSNYYIKKCLRGLIFTAKVPSSLSHVTFTCGPNFNVDFPICYFDCTCCV